jgi:hypothetical protein
VREETKALIAAKLSGARRVEHRVHRREDGVLLALLEEVSRECDAKAVRV